MRLGFGRDELDNAPHRRSQLNQKPSRIYSSLERRAKTPRRSSHDKLAVQGLSESVILDATEESILRLGNRPSSFNLEPSSNTLPTLRRRPGRAKMGLSTVDDLRYTTDSLFESFRWLEDGDDLDLRLLLDDYGCNVGAKNLQPQVKRNPSHRRHQTISKFHFGNAANRTGAREAGADSALPALPQEPTLGSTAQGQANRRSRALSLVTPGRQPMPEPAASIDASAAHYQDPDARMKLRVYLASPHKFDEAIEFGFPSIEEVQGGARLRHKRLASQHERSNGRPGKLHLFAEDDKSSLYSDEASTAEPDSPKTPSTLDKALPVKAVRTSRDEDGSATKVDYAQAPASSREMTLRMTLTRPDLRANEDQIYGWQKSASGRKSQTKDEASPAVSVNREAHSKESIERQLAAMDQEEMLAAHDSRVVKRFWNRMRRS